MSIDAVSAISPLGNVTSLASMEAAKLETPKPETPKPETQSAFGEILMEELKNVDSQIKQADQSVRELAVGANENLHQVMLELTKAQTSFELTVQVRNRIVEGFQQMMRMSI